MNLILNNLLELWKKKTHGIVLELIRQMFNMIKCYLKKKSEFLRNTS